MYSQKNLEFKHKRDIFITPYFPQKKIWRDIFITAWYFYHLVSRKNSEWEVVKINCPLRIGGRGLLFRLLLLLPFCSFPPPACMQRIENWKLNPNFCRVFPVLTVFIFKIRRFYFLSRYIYCFCSFLINNMQLLWINTNGRILNV